MEYPKKKPKKDVEIQNERELFIESNQNQLKNAMFPQHNEKNIVFLLILFILFISINVNALSYSFSGTYFNASSSDIVDQHYGIHGFVIFSNSYIKSGIDRLELRTHGTIHTPINSSIFTKRESYIIPIMVGYRKPISKRIKIHGEVGLNIPIMDT